MTSIHDTIIFVIRLAINIGHYYSKLLLTKNQTPESIWGPHLEKCCSVILPLSVWSKLGCCHISRFQVREKHGRDVASSSVLRAWAWKWQHQVSSHSLKTTQTCALSKLKERLGNVTVLHSYTHTILFLRKEQE